jgi:ribokinase
MGASDSGSHVVVVGSINVDYIVRLPRLPQRGETVTGGTLVTRDGGKGANQAVAAARFGARVRFIGAVGDDAAGRAAISALTHEGVDTDDIAIIPEAATGHAAVLVDDDGDNQIAVASGANHRIGSDHVRAALSDRPVHGADAVLLSFEIPDPPIVAAAQHAHSRGATVIVNPAPWRPLPRELVEVSPILTPNAREALSLDGAADATARDRAAIRAAAHRLSAATRAPVVVTTGAEGVVAVIDGRAISQRPPAVAVHDTTGAGDAFSGVLAAALASGEPLSEALRLATAAASLSTTGAGARQALADRDQVMAAVASMPPADDQPPIR